MNQVGTFVGLLNFHKQKDIAVLIFHLVYQFLKTVQIFAFDVLDEDFCQPYDYQYMLHKNPTFEPALIVYEQVEELMEYLQSKGVLSGHVKGGYI